MPMPRKNKILKIGDRAPLFALRPAHQNEVRLESYQGKSNVILVFFRGTW